MTRRTDKRVAIRPFYLSPVAGGIGGGKKARTRVRADDEVRWGGIDYVWFWSVIQKDGEARAIGARAVLTNVVTVAYGFISMGSPL